MVKLLALPILLYSLAIPVMLYVIFRQASSDLPTQYVTENWTTLIYWEWYMPATLLMIALLLVSAGVFFQKKLAQKFALAMNILLLLFIPFLILLSYGAVLSWWPILVFVALLSFFSIIGFMPIFLGSPKNIKSK